MPAMTRKASREMSRMRKRTGRAGILCVSAPDRRFRCVGRGPADSIADPHQRWKRIALRTHTFDVSETVEDDMRGGGLSTCEIEVE